ncbi:hypothetical protein [Desulforamulus ferrireducens]|uniref:hypothetical protein n=1 Tax=Desulforamulus ferrireducens TaxID=1833852 RepID=UPI0013566776|nr:hypothetical protein [Desulforamulus ferrireducens]
MLQRIFQPRCIHLIILGKDPHMADPKLVTLPETASKASTLPAAIPVSKANTLEE